MFIILAAQGGRGARAGPGKSSSYPACRALPAVLIRAAYAASSNRTHHSTTESTTPCSCVSQARIPHQHLPYLTLHMQALHTPTPPRASFNHTPLTRPAPLPAPAGAPARAAATTTALPAASATTTAPPGGPAAPAGAGAPGAAPPTRNLHFESYKQRPGGLATAAGLRQDCLQQQWRLIVVGQGASARGHLPPCLPAAWSRI